MWRAAVIWYPRTPGESPVQCCAGPTTTALAGVVFLAGGVVVLSWEMSSFRFAAALPLMCSTCAFTALVAVLWCGCRHLMWFHPIGTACGGSLSHGVRLWAGAEAKAFACLQADDGDALGCRFPPWRHHVFAPSPSAPHGWSPGGWIILCTCLASFYTLSS